MRSIAAAIALTCIAIGACAKWPYNMMMSYKATVFALGPIVPHPNADRVRLTTIFGNQVVVGRFLDRQGERAARKFDELKKRFDETLTSIADEIDAELDRAQARKSDAQKEQERLNKEKLERLRFGMPIMAYGRDGFYIGPRDPNSPIFGGDHEVALQAPGKCYSTFVRLDMITIKD